MKERERDIKGTLCNIPGAIFNICTGRTNRIDLSDKVKFIIFSQGYEWLFKDAFLFHCST